MDFSHSLIGTAALKTAIDDQPLIVSPQTPLIEVLDRMSQARGYRCGLVNDEVDNDRYGHSANSSARQTSCALIAEGNRIVGIFTERDIVKLVAQDSPLELLTVANVMISPVISLAESEFKDIFAPLFLFRRYRIRHLLIVDNCDRPIGIVSPESIRAVLRPANLLKIRRVSDIMARDVICATHGSTVLSIAQLMAENRVSCVVITENNEERGVLPVGIVTERDIVQFKTLQLNLNTVQAGSVMSAPLFLLSPEDSLWTAHQEMQRLRVRRLVVSWNWGKGLGLVTQTSLLRVFDPLEMYGVLETLQATVQQLQVEKQIPSFQPSLFSNDEISSASANDRKILPICSTAPGITVSGITASGIDSTTTSRPSLDLSQPTLLALKQCLEHLSNTVKQTQAALPVAAPANMTSLLLNLIMVLNDQAQYLSGVLESNTPIAQENLSSSEHLETPFIPDNHDLYNF